MPTVLNLLRNDATGAVWLLDVSFDDFETVSYRWSSASVRIDGNDYDGRIASMSPIERGFGRDHLPAATTTKITIDNSDFGADWMLDVTTVATQLLRARFKLSVYLYDSRAYTTAADELSGAQQTIGYFTCLDQPQLQASTIDIALSDDSLGRLAEPLATPTVRDWKDAAVSAIADPSLNPLRANEPSPAMDWDNPLPLVFGMGEVNVQVPAYLAVADYAEWKGLYNAQDIYRRGLVVPVKFPIVVCAAKANNAAHVPHDGEITRLYGTYRPDVAQKPQMAGLTVEIPRSFTTQVPKINLTDPEMRTVMEIWKPRRSAEFTKNGRQWQVVWIEFNVDAYAIWFHQNFDDQVGPTAGQGSAGIYNVAGVHNSLPIAPGTSDQKSRGNIMGGFASFTCNGTPLSMVTTLVDPDGRTVTSWRLVDIIHDVIAYYSKASSTDIDEAAFTRARRARNSVAGGGIIQPARPRPRFGSEPQGWRSPNPRNGIMGVLRAALGDMCSSADVDLFMTKEGLYSLSANAFDFTAATETRTSITESRLERVRVRIPSEGERWAPYNRVFLVGPGGDQLGPYDNQDGIDEWGVVLPITLQANWNLAPWGEGAGQVAADVWFYRKLESQVRPVIAFLADREHLALELGQNIEFTWSRGGNSAFYGDTVFRVESQRIDPATLAVELGAVWVNDITTASPYLLDDETLLVRVASSAGRTVSVTDGNTTATFNIGDLGTDGVEAGDILELKDASQADNVFTRYRRLRIASVDSDKEVTVVAPDDDPDLDFDAPGGATVTTWTIYRGATTYHDSVSDPSNYPSDGDMYGKASNTSDVYSDASAANQLLDG